MKIAKQQKRFFAAFLAMILIITTCVPNISAKASGNTSDAITYSGGYSITEILSKYQLFVEGDMNTGSHSVGAVACGGTGSIGAFGDGAIENSYFAKVTSVNNYAAGAYFNNFTGTLKDEYAKYVGATKCYYMEGNLSGTYFEQVSVPYINFDSAFATIRAESKAMADAGYKPADSDIVDYGNGSPKLLNLDFSKHSSYTIDADLFYKITSINVTGLNSVDDFKTKDCTINIVGVDEVKLEFGSAWVTDPTATTKRVMFNSSDPYGTFENKLKNMANDCGTSELNVGGMKFMTNIVDATSVNITQGCGHIVAPNAAISVTGGNYEGNVIAKEILSCQSEGHFYPYNATPAAPDTVKLGSLDTLVTVKGTGEQISGVTIDVKNADGDVIKSVVSAKDYNVAVSGLEPGEYTLVVTGVPDGYKVSGNKELKQTVEADKTTTYPFIIEADSGEVEKGSLEITVKDKTTEDPIPETKVEIYNEEGESVGIFETDAKGKVIVPDLPAGSYTVEVVEVPDGYDIPESQDKVVEEGITTKADFVLERIEDSTGEEETKGSLETVVVEAGTTNKVAGATIEVRNEAGELIKTVTSKADGSVVVEDLEVGDYTLTVTKVPDGYTASGVTSLTKEVKADQTTTYQFEVEKEVAKGSLETVVVEAGTTNKVA
ncbi:MAG: SpaA isopeptide-forming pilin-related protein, partial [Coprococcus sp.]